MCHLQLEFFKQQHQQYRDQINQSQHELQTVLRPILLKCRFVSSTIGILLKSRFVKTSTMGIFLKSRFGSSTIYIFKVHVSQKRYILNFFRFLYVILATRNSTFLPLAYWFYPSTWRFNLNS